MKEAFCLKKNRLGLKIFIFVILLIIIIVLAAVGFVSSKLDLINYDSGVPQTQMTEEEAKQLSEESTVIEDSYNIDELEKLEEPIESTLEDYNDDKIYNIILIGTDERSLDFVEHARADSITLLSLNKKEGTAKLVSFERGIGMPITAGEYEGYWELLTHIFAYGGADMVVSDIRDNFKVDVEKYVHVNFNALIKVIDILGGVDVELTDREANHLNSIKYPYRGDAGSEEHAFVSGTNHLSGVMALSYARLRAIDSNWHRVERQRNVIQAISYKLKDADLVTLNNLCNEILPLVQTNLTKDDIAELMLAAPKFLGLQFEQMTMPERGTFGYMEGLFGKSMIALDFEKNSIILRDFLYGES